MKRLTAFILCLAMIFALAACTAAPAADDGKKTETTDQTTTNTPTEAEKPAEENSLAGKKIEMATRTSGKSNELLTALIAQFKEETGIEVVLTTYNADDYESALKTRMASNELPDVWETHGWSRLRYGEYLYPVNDEPWYANESDLAKGILTGDGDTAYALMLTTSVLGVVCNKTAAEAAGIDVYAINTLDDFTAACQTAVDAGLVPMVNHSSAGDLTHIAGVFTTYDDAIANDMAAQLDGTWDWEDFMLELHYFSNLIDMGAYWEDRSTMDSTADIERLATGKSLFYFANSSSYIAKLHDLNPDAEFVMIPFPAASETAKRYIAGGEGYAVGANKDSAELDAARAWLSFLSENGGELAQSYSGISCISTAPRNEDDYGASAGYDVLDKYTDVEFVNMWDREYMPSGMWGSFGEAAGMFYADNSEENLVAIKDFLHDNYLEKYAAAHG